MINKSCYICNEFESNINFVNVNYCGNQCSEKNNVHETCLMGWFKINLLCPICSRKLKVKENRSFSTLLNFFLFILNEFKNYINRHIDATSLIFCFLLSCYIKSEKSNWNLSIFFIFTYLCASVRIRTVTGCFIILISVIFFFDMSHAALLVFSTLIIDSATLESLDMLEQGKPIKWIFQCLFLFQIPTYIISEAILIYFEEYRIIIMILELCLITFTQLMSLTLWTNEMLFKEISHTWSRFILSYYSEKNYISMITIE